MAQPLKVLFLPRWYPNRSDPMPGLFIRRHAVAVSAFYEVAVLYVHLNSGMQDNTFEVTRSNDHGIKEFSIYYRASTCKISVVASVLNLLLFFAAHVKGFRIINREFGKPDLLHVNVLTRLGFIAFIYKILHGKPYVVTEHWTRYLPGMDNFHGFLRKLITKVVVRNASAVMPVTLNLQKAMELHGLKNSNYRVIPNVVNTNWFVPDYQVMKHEKASILHVSCFDDKQKNISGILRVLKELSGKRQDWYCMMVGEGIDYEELVRFAESLGIKENFVKFTGLKENEELAEIMQHADFQVLFSRYENFPVVIPESFACGVPFISTNVGGIAEYVHEDQGLLVVSEDEPALLAAIETMLDKYDRYDKNGIRQYAVDHFSNEVIGRQIADVYKEIFLRK